ncbi:hypothetical protein C5B93_09840 [Rathayibacter sp. AY1A2]|nr:hypothetical protein C5B93_09840 [Rathayibacter sp. AY1A2]
MQAMLVLRLTAGAELGAAGVFEVLAGDRYTATTAGLSPADTVNPAIAATVAELGLDISDRTPPPSQWRTSRTRTSSSP